MRYVEELAVSTPQKGSLALPSEAGKANIETPAKKVPQRPFAVLEMRFVIVSSFVVPSRIFDKLRSLQ